MNDRAQVKFQGPKYILAGKEQMEFYFIVNRKKTTISTLPIYRMIFVNK